MQKVVINSSNAKLLAVRAVTTLNKGRQTSGVDKQVLVTHDDKMAEVRSLSLDPKSSPIKRVWILKPLLRTKTEKRPLGIPTIKDRAKQERVKEALEPQWEALFSPNSYGFRPGRSAHDALEALFLALRHNAPKWVFEWGPYTSGGSVSPNRH